MMVRCAAYSSGRPATVLFTDFPRTATLELRPSSGNRLPTRSWRDCVGKSKAKSSRDQVGHLKAAPLPDMVGRAILPCRWTPAPMAIAMSKMPGYSNQTRA